MKDSEDDLIRSIECNHSWPVCLFDFTYKNMISEFFVFKVRKFEVIEDYFKDNLGDSSDSV